MSFLFAPEVKTAGVDFDQFFKVNTSNGNRESTSVDVVIKVNPNNGSATTVITETVSGKSFNPYNRDYGIDLRDLSGYNTTDLPMASIEKEFGEALDQFNNGLAPAGNSGHLAAELYKGIQLAAQCARANNMDRAFAIAPTASCSYRSQDLDGYTCTPEIAPPIAKSVDRDSGTFGVQTYDYGNVEIASEVGWDAYKKVADGFMTMLNKTGLLHGYSFNSWSDVVTYDREFVEEWLLSPQTSLYYSLQVMGDVQDKTDAYAALDQAEVDDYLQDILNEPVTCDCQE